MNMNIGTLSPLPASKGQYTRYTYTHNKNEYLVHVFRTVNKQTIVPGISMTKKDLSEINPVSAAAKVIAKINGGMFDRNGTTFYGFFYQGPGHSMYVDGKAYSSVNEIPDNAGIFTSKKYWPSFCVKTDGTATIRWFSNKAKLTSALPYCTSIIAGAHPMVYGGESVLRTSMRDYDNVLICNPNNLADQNTRFNANLVDPYEKDLRTLLGYNTDGQYVMVCTGTQMTLPVAADLMLDLNCEVAVNMDGGYSTAMRIKEGYGPGGKATLSYSRNVPNAVCAVIE